MAAPKKKVTTKKVTKTTTAKIEPVEATAKKSTARAKKAAAPKKSKVDSNVETMESAVDTTPEVSEKTASSSKVSTSKYMTRRNILLAAGLVGLVVLGYLLMRFMVVAWVDNMPVTRMQLYQELEKKYGGDLQEQLISQQLISSEASKRGVSATDAEIAAEYRKIEDQQGGADKLAQILQFQNLTPDELRSQIRYQILIEKMFGKDINVTDDEITQYVANNKELFPEQVDLTKASSESAKIKTDVTDQLRRQKIGQAFNTWLREAQQSDRVKRLNGTAPTPAAQPIGG